jgi:copper chaperone NosL
MSKLSRLLLAFASGLVLLALALPLWRVQLVAPQYPEGLGMEIRANTVRGATEHDLRSINSLNHYIGMKAIEPEEIADLRVIPWVFGGLALFGVIAAAIGRRWLGITWLAAFAIAGAVGLWDFHRWEYSYGHDLDLAHAIIKVPGMSYQPPLIGSKQLLNFVAMSWPASGSFILGAAFVLGAAALFLRAPRHAVAHHHLEHAA